MSDKLLGKLLKKLNELAQNPEFRKNNPKLFKLLQKILPKLKKIKDYMEYIIKNCSCDFEKRMKWVCLLYDATFGDKIAESLEYTNGMRKKIDQLRPNEEDKKRNREKRVYGFADIYVNGSATPVRVNAISTKDSLIQPESDTEGNTYNGNIFVGNVPAKTKFPFSGGDNHAEVKIVEYVAKTYGNQNVELRMFVDKVQCSNCEKYINSVNASANIQVKDINGNPYNSLTSIPKNVPYRREEAIPTQPNGYYNKYKCSN